MEANNIYIVNNIYCEAPRPVKCRFGHKCYNFACPDIHEDTIICMDKTNCTDFYCKNRHAKCRKRPCAAGGGCTNKNCVFLHPIGAEASIELELPCEGYLKYLAKLNRFNFIIDKKTNIVKLTSNRGTGSVGPAINILKRKKAILITIKQLKDAKLSADKIHKLFNNFNNDQFVKLLNDYFRKQGFPQLEIVLLERTLLFVININEEFPTLGFIINELENNLQYVELPNTKKNDAWLDLVKPKEEYVVTAKKNECEIFTFGDIYSMDAQEYIHHIKKILGTNKIKCEKHVCQYLTTYSKMFNLLIAKELCRVESDKTGCYIIFDNFGRYCENTVEQKIDNMIQKVCTIEHTMVNGHNEMCRFLNAKFPKTTAITEGWNILITTNMKNVDNILKFLNSLRDPEIKTISVRRSYANFLMRYGDKIIGSNHPFVISAFMVMIITKKGESIEEIKTKIINGSNSSDSLESLNSAKYEYLVDEYEKYHRKKAMWIQKKHNVVLDERTNGNVMTISFLGIANLTQNAYKQYDEYDEYTFCMEFSKWIYRRKGIKNDAKETGVTVNVSLTKSGEIKLCIQGDKSSVNEFKNYC